MAMLRKLMKYELRANMKIYCFLWPGIVIAILLQRLLLPTGFPGELRSFLSPLVSMLLIFSIFGSIIAAMVICINRFYKGLLQEEGYLMFTLPVHAWQLILSKLLVAMMTIIVTGLLSFGSMLLFINGVLENLSIHDLFSELGEITGRAPVDELILGIICLILAQALSILLIYLACAIGHLAKKHRVVASIAAYFGVSYGLQFLKELLQQTEIHDSLWMVTLGLCAITALCFYLTHLILQKRLNLE